MPMSCTILKLAF